MPELKPLECLGCHLINCHRYGGYAVMFAQQNCKSNVFLPWIAVLLLFSDETVGLVDLYNSNSSMD